MEISRAMFDQQRHPKFGTSNPERMQFPFWEWMIRGGDDTPTELAGVLGRFGFRMREGRLKSGYGPWRARDYFNVPADRAEGPIWTFERMGRTHTELPDGRIVCVGGEHEDFYDPDFCIYNDVVVFTPPDGIEIYGYPRDVFPPTDFHTATLMGERIILVGCLGYSEERRVGDTPVYSLDLSNYRISKLETSGQMPGWISEHTADSDPEGHVTIRGGQVIDHIDGKNRLRPNLEDYTLDLHTGVWRRVSDRNWRWFSVRQADGKWFTPRSDLISTEVLPIRLPISRLRREDARQVRFDLGGMKVSITVDPASVSVVIEGPLPDELVRSLVEEVRAKTESAVRRPCQVVRL